MLGDAGGGDARNSSKWQQKVCSSLNRAEAALSSYRFSLIFFRYALCTRLVCHTASQQVRSTTVIRHFLCVLVGFRFDDLRMACRKCETNY